MKKSARFALFAGLLILTALALILYFSGNRQEAPSATSPVALSEVMASNKGSVPDESGEYPDWIELYNTSTEAVEIGGFGLTDDLTAGAKYVFPAGTTIPANGYIVVWCSGESTGAFHAPFRLGAGESVILFGVTGNTLDTVTITAAASGKSLSKTASGLWAETSPSPGFSNDQAGIAAYEATLMEAGETTGITINEFMASNATTLADAYGNYSDWIELYNDNDVEKDVSGFGISDSLAQPKKYALPEGTVIPAKGYLIIFCSGNEGFAENGELHAPFGLRSYGEDVVLSGKNGAILDSFTYTNQQTDASMARTPDGTGEFAPSTHPTPGYSNDDAGYTAFMAASALPRGNVILNEIIGNNVAAKKAADGDYYDAIELKNTGGEPVSLSGYALSDNPKNPARWVFGDVTIPAGGFLVVFCTGENVNAGGELHANLGLSNEGDSVYLFGPDGVLCDKLQAGAFLPDVSYGRDSAGGLAYFTTPTLGGENGSGYGGVTAVPTLSLTPGIFDGPVEIALSAPAGETIHYTLDCTTPTAASPVYTGPIKADKNTVVRAVSIREGYLTNQTVSGTYLFTADGVNHSIPVATLVTDPDNLWSSATGIYAFGDQYDPDLPYGKALETAQFYQSKKNEDAWERAASFAIFGDEGAQVFSQNVGIRIAGSFGRGRAQKGFNIFARDEYGANRMEYPFFDDLPYTEYKSLVLRAGAQDQNNGKFRDELAAGLLSGSDVNFLYQTYRPYVLYLNGEYWGIYFLKEKRNRFFVAQHEGTADTVNMNIIRSEDTAIYGSTKEWRELMAYVRANGASSPQAYAYISERVDLDSFMDYMICEIYSANSDVWNIQYYKLPGGKWKWIYYDFCWSFGSTYNADTRDRADHQTLSIRRLSSKPCSDLFNALLKNSDWQDAFCRRFAQLLNNIFAPEKVLSVIDELYAVTEPEIAREREKFNGETWLGVKQHAEVKGTYEGFLKQVEYMRYFAENRPASIKAQIQKEFGLSDSYMKEVFG